MGFDRGDYHSVGLEFEFSRAGQGMEPLVQVSALLNGNRSGVGNVTRKRGRNTDFD
jgi:hypothetical protein